MGRVFDDILKFIETLNVIDTHEHLPSREDERDKDTDVLKEYLLHYYNCDLITAGLPKSDYLKVAEGKVPIEEKWNLLEPYWNVSKYTGYGRSLSIAARDIYGIEEIDKDSIVELNNRFRESLKPGHFKKILKDMCRIKTSLLNVHLLDSSSKSYAPHIRCIDCDKDFFSPVYVVDILINPTSLDHIELIEYESGVKITSFKRWLEATEKLINRAYLLGAVALKNGLAYWRSLKYERVSSSSAEDEFNNIFKTRHLKGQYTQSVCTGKSFQDYMFHFILDIANKKNLVVQIHTGIQEGNGNILSNSNPELLLNLFLEYPDVKFDIFHIGYPYQYVLTVLAKNFPNVFVDMCWAHIISPNASVNSLIEWIDTLPMNKISAFGGDYMLVDGVYGHLTIAKENVARALSLKSEQGLFDIEKAKEIARMLFYDNPLKIFNL